MGCAASSSAPGGHSAQPALRRNKRNLAKRGDRRVHYADDKLAATLDQGDTSFDDGADLPCINHLVACSNKHHHSGPTYIQRPGTPRSDRQRPSSGAVDARNGRVAVPATIVDESCDDLVTFLVNTDAHDDSLRFRPDRPNDELAAAGAQQQEPMLTHLPRDIVVGAMPIATSSCCRCSSRGPGELASAEETPSATATVRPSNRCNDDATDVATSAAVSFPGPLPPLPPPPPRPAAPAVDTAAHLWHPCAPAEGLGDGSAWSLRHVSLVDSASRSFGASVSRLPGVLLQEEPAIASDRRTLHNANDSCSSLSPQQRSQSGLPLFSALAFNTHGGRVSTEAAPVPEPNAHSELPAHNPVAQLSLTQHNLSGWLRILDDADDGQASLVVPWEPQGHQI